MVFILISEFVKNTNVFNSIKTTIDNKQKYIQIQANFFNETLV
jgi:hypothetical protein